MKGRNSLEKGVSSFGVAATGGVCYVGVRVCVCAAWRNVTDPSTLFGCEIRIPFSLCTIETSSVTCPQQEEVSCESSSSLITSFTA